eukprot:COSAG02_NODE_21165_length_799_cov_1.351429_1_plen_193_part_00
MLLEASEKKLVAMCEERKLSTSTLKGCNNKKRSLARRLAQDDWGADSCDAQYLDGTTPPAGDTGDCVDNDESGSESEDEDLDEDTKYTLEDSDDDESDDDNSEEPEDKTCLADFVAAATEGPFVCAPEPQTCSPDDHVAVKRRGGWVIGRVVRAVDETRAGYIGFGRKQLRQNILSGAVSARSVTEPNGRSQ